ncbi:MULTISPECIES: KOW domain-containing RNA-binding protein [Anaerosinus]|uniref:KOW domain-containing RNA-binding protein n=1 Tax=Selenobaculum gibii TaxID=3054208 RepID=A0A9Y2AFV9_9FIRM|nr:KOW domain-containing RNA-binding protein [Selenobaculum gbiensis]WIW70074.1 KOW domain-containing RNA-binding protein [Selenobaculum gbiensis]
MKSVYPISLGQKVESITGRDANKIYLVVAIKGKEVFLANGRERKLANPKKKNIRHVKVYKWIAEAVADKFASNKKVTDEDIRLAIVKCTSDNL